jgi:hypothetical protein
MNVRELREYIQTAPPKADALDTFEFMKVWYFANCHLITIGEDAAFRRYLSELEKLTQ